MKPRILFTAATLMLATAGTASAQSYYPATYQEPYCREFTKVVDIGGRAQQAYGQACLQPDGSWQIVSDDIPAAQPVQYVPAQNYVAYEPIQPYPVYRPYYQPASVFSISFSSWNGGGNNWRGSRGWNFAQNNRNNHRSWTDRGNGDWRGHSHGGNGHRNGGGQRGRH